MTFWAIEFATFRIFYYSLILSVVIIKGFTSIIIGKSIICILLEKFINARRKYSVL